MVRDESERSGGRRVRRIRRLRAVVLRRRRAVPRDSAHRPNQLTHSPEAVVSAKLKSPVLTIMSMWAFERMVGMRTARGLRREMVALANSSCSVDTRSTLSSMSR